MSNTIEQLRIYQTARQLEDQVYELVKTFPADEYYSLGNDLRRSSAAVAHYVMETHKFFSYRLKMDALASMRREAEATQKHLEKAQELGATDEMVQGYTGLIKQSWGLTKWLRAKLAEAAEEREVAQ
jgi:four helix bundle protein